MISLPPQSSQKAPAFQQEAKHFQKPVLSFLGNPMLIRIAEYAISTFSGAFLLFMFFMLSEASVFFIKDSPYIAITFVPTICLLPLLSGALAVVILEWLRKQQVDVKHGIILGLASGFAGSSMAFAVLGLLSLLNVKVFGGFVSSPIISIGLLAASIVISTFLGALGGAITAKFISER